MLTRYLYHFRWISQSAEVPGGAPGGGGEAGLQPYSPLQDCQHGGAQSVPLAEKQIPRGHFLWEIQHPREQQRDRYCPGARGYPGSC